MELATLKQLNMLPRNGLLMAMFIRDEKSMEDII